MKYLLIVLALVLGGCNSDERDGLGNPLPGFDKIGQDPGVYRFIDQQFGVACYRVAGKLSCVRLVVSQGAQ